MEYVQQDHKIIWTVIQRTLNSSDCSHVWSRRLTKLGKLCIKIFCSRSQDVYNRSINWIEKETFQKCLPINFVWNMFCIRCPMQQFFVQSSDPTGSYLLLYLKNTPTWSLFTEQRIKSTQFMPHILKQMPCKTSPEILLISRTCQVILPPHKTLAANTSYKYPKKNAQVWISVSKLWSCNITGYCGMSEGVEGGNCTCSSRRDLQKVISRLLWSEQSGRENHMCSSRGRSLESDNQISERACTFYWQLLQSIHVHDAVHKVYSDFPVIWNPVNVLQLAMQLYDDHR
jgi:hypothetical protein